MKYLAIIFISIFLSSSSAFANMQCGMKPFAPMGCYNAQAVCQCDSNRNCAWLFLGC